MLDPINGSSNSTPAEPVRSNSSDSTPATGQPAGVEEVEPDVAVAISDMAQARMEGMMAPAESNSTTTLQMDETSGSFNFGVEMGGFAWPLDSGAPSTSEGADVDSVDAWKASENTVNGVLVGDAEAGESAYIALGKSTVNASE